jgi:hypothetical protein
VLARQSASRGRKAGHAVWPIGILAVNLIGDCVNFVARHDPRTLIGLPIGGAMIIYLWKTGSSE